MPSFRRVEIEGIDDIYQDPKFGSYYLRIYLDWEDLKKRERYRTLGTRNLRQALDRAKVLRAEVARLDPTKAPRRYEDIARKCFDVRLEKNTKKRRSTVTEAKRIYENYLIRAFGPHMIEDVTDELWLEQLEAWRQSTDRTTFANIRKYAVQIDRFAHRRGWKKDRCDFPIDDPKAREGVVLSDDEFAVALDGCLNWYRKGVYIRPKVKTNLIQGKRALLFLLCGRYMGMRRSEITQLRKDRIDFADRSIELKPEDVKTGSKTGRGRKFAIAPECFDALAEAVQATEGQWLFANRLGTGPVDKKSINRVIKRLNEAIGAHFNPHDLRHTFVTVKLFVEKKDPMSVAIYVGMSLQVMQDRYLHPTVDDTRHVVEVQDLQNREFSESHKVRSANA